MDFKNKIVLITGAGSGIGRNTAEAFAKAGAQVVVSDINIAGGEETVKQIHAESGKATFVKCDVANYEEVQQLIKTIVAQHGQLDIAVNNAGIAPKEPAKTGESSLYDWEQVIAINQTGVFYCMKEELKQMMQQESGNIINISSVAGLKALPENLSYVASKHAVVGMTKTAALEYARQGIRLNAVCPVFTVSPMFDPAQLGDYAEKLKRLIPMKRFGRTQEIADVILWLASEQSSFVTGQAIAVDGGMTA